MKGLFTLALCLPLLLTAQETGVDTAATIGSLDSVALLGDTTVYRFADEAPRFPTPCEKYDTTAAAKAECSDAAVLRYVNARTGYPEEARRENITGMAVVGFVVEANGVISRAQILRDPGGGLGYAALKAVAEMAREVRWRPAVQDSQFVRFQYTLPIRFKLEEPKPYVISGADTIYTQPTRQMAFTGADGQLGTYFDEKLSYPPVGEDSCLVGQLDVQMLVDAKGQVRVQDITDYNDLGSDFTFEAIQVATSTSGQWAPAEYEGRPVTGAYNISISFVPESEACSYHIEAYEEAINAVNEGQAMLLDSTTITAGLERLDAAVERFPRDGRFRIVRGQARMDNNLLSGACEDFRMAKQIALIDWYDGVLPLLCREVAE